MRRSNNKTIKEWQIPKNDKGTKLYKINKLCTEEIKKYVKQIGIIKKYEGEENL